MTRARRHRHLWYDVGWPILAGLVIATGVAAACRGRGPGIVLASFLVTDLALMPLAWVLATATERPARRAVLVVTPAVTLGLVVGVGLVGAWQAWGLVPLAVVVATSPMLAGRQQWSQQVHEAVRTVETRRAFDDIVRHSFEPTPGDDQDPGGGGAGL
jgi:hypothetical protein